MDGGRVVDGFFGEIKKKALFFDFFWHQTKIIRGS
jgi:hypothetical protein